MAKPSMIKQVANFAYEKFTKKPGDFLLVSGIIGWAASCVNQTVAIMINKDIPKEQKYFLIPQEITDGIVNIILFAACTRIFTRVGERLVENGRVLTKDLKKTLVEDLKVGDKIATPEFDVKKLDIMDDAKACSPKMEKFREDYNHFHKGVSFVFSTIGSVIACDFVTPFVRNKIAAGRQKKAIEKDKQEALRLHDISAPILPAQNQVGQDKYRNAVNPYPKSGALKI